MTTPNTQEIWKQKAIALDAIQEKAIDAESAEALIKLLLEMDLPVPRQEISIVYQNYGANKAEFWATAETVRNRKVNELGGTDSIDDEPESSHFAASHPVITEVIQTGEVRHLKTAAECQKAEITAYKSFLVVPMKLRETKVTGAFILHSTQEDAYSDELAEVFDVLSNRFAYYIRHNARKRRGAVFQRIQNTLLSTDFKTEEGILKKFVETTHNWFEHDNVAVLLKYPLDTKKFVLAYRPNLETCTPELVNNFRQQPPLSTEKVTYYFGDTLDNLLEQPLCLNKKTEIHQHEIGLPCNSWLAAPMRLKHGVVIGYLVLFNPDVEDAFDTDEDQFLDALSDSVASVIGNLRDDKFQQALREIKQFQLKTALNEVTEKDQKENQEKIHALYALVDDQLRQLYGVQDLHIYRYTRNNLSFEAIYPQDNPPEANVEAIKSKALAFVQEEVAAHSRGPKPTHQIDDFFIAPMRTEHRNVGCFIFTAPHIGGFTKQAIDDISDALAEKVDEYERWERYRLLNEYGRAFSSTEITLESILNKTHEFISEVMFTQNLYIALYDQEKKEVHFPFALKNNQDWLTVKETRRVIDPNKQGKTEAIILEEKYILHRTHEESKAWYKQQPFQGLIKSAPYSTSIN